MYLETQTKFLILTLDEISSDVIFFFWLELNGENEILGFENTTVSFKEIFKPIRPSSNLVGYCLKRSFQNIKHTRLKTILYEAVEIMLNL